MTDRLTEAQLATIHRVMKDFETWRHDDSAGYDSLIGISCAMDDAVAALDAELAAARQQIATLTAERDAWKDAIIDAAVVDWIYTAEHDTNPRKAVNDLLCWQQKIALDPAVSEDAAKLHQQIATLTAALKTARRVLEVACGTTAPYIREAFARIDTAIAESGRWGK